MILALDVGNTNIVIGCLDDDRIYFVGRLATDLSLIHIYSLTTRVGVCIIRLVLP